MSLVELVLGLSPVLICALCAVVVLFLSRGGQARAAANGRRKIPLSEDYIRPAGESLRQEMERIQRRLLFATCFAVAAPLLVVLLHLATSLFFRIEESWWRGLVDVGAAGFSGWWGWGRVRALRRKLRNYRMGYLGEIYVGGLLQKLEHKGLRVFHDLNCSLGNIDHVIVGARGVFVVETKMRSKPDTGDGKSDCKVEFTGDAITFPDRNEVNALGQVKNNARWLSGQLEKKLGVKYFVTPIVALPGWFVSKSEGVNGGLHVVNPKNIATLVDTKFKGPLTPETQEAIAGFLEELCRGKVSDVCRE